MISDSYTNAVISLYTVKYNLRCISLFISATA